MNVLRYIGLQALNLLLMAIGVLLLIPFCLCKHWVWEESKRNRSPHLIAYWPYAWMWVWGNDEDGVTGRLGYNPDNTSWLAYLWSAWRNPADNFKYLGWTQFQGGPWFYRTATVFKWTLYISLGWRTTDGFLVGSAGII